MKIIKWAARIIGFIASAFFLSFFIGEGVPDLISGNADDLIPFLPLFLLTILGYVISWFSSFWGGSLMLLGGIGMWGYHLAFNHSWRIAAVFGLPFVIAGLLFLIYWHKMDFNSTRKYF
jgi:hypothetical protein